ncbi:hypothetical protein [Coprobacillus sp. AF33-1AC]|uniref:rolling circle replication-associated protein n=1 Tax=Coprobacillus sp. AF33-1AC TaxID=2292032 RepID=UPI000E4CC8EB|nr:hypothetical protein [Coprobacillus sp. AF33-1AC]RHM59678.1 hypothetical protein DWZ53_09030 [Coprobacillus sp. AF33-1AC]
MNHNKSTKRKPYIDYDYENYYDNRFNQEDLDIKKLLDKNLIGVQYCSKTIQSGNQFEIEIYPLFSKKEMDKFNPSKKPTRLAQKSLNDRNARKHFIRLINNNFNKDDYVMHLTYSNENLPPTIEAAEKEVYKFIRKINYRRKKLGLKNAKWIYVTEHDPNKKIRIHHHLIIEKGLDRKLMKDLWMLGTRIKVEELEPDEDGLTGLATYLSKDPKGKKRWKGSKWLKKPIERKSYTVFSKKKIKNMISNEMLVSQYLNANYKSKKYVKHEIRYNKVNRMYYIYARMINKKVNERRTI